MLDWEYSIEEGDCCDTGPARVKGDQLLVVTENEACILVHSTRIT
jgi:hypothetical protein